MDHPLLSSLCRICNINVPKYTCPRCSLQTCSLPCSRRHKLWSECSGARDPTVYKPRSQLATPSGIDHDYNFLHSIEHQIERSEQQIVEDRGLVGKDELELARRQAEPDWRERNRKRKRENPGEVPIERSLKSMRTTVELAPKGMKRNQENGTSWSKNHRCINWQVEWICEGRAGRSLSKAMGNKPIGEFYAALLEGQRRAFMSDEEKRVEKKQRAAETKQRLATRPISGGNSNLTTLPILQNPETGAWASDSAQSAQSASAAKPGGVSTATEIAIPSHHLYLHRPHTPSSFPKVLVPLDPTKPLDQLLKKRLVLEFPTIYAFESGPEDLPNEFMLEKDYLIARGQPPWQDSDTEMLDTSSDESEDLEDEDETSSSGSSSDEDMEDGEVLE